MIIIKNNQMFAYFIAISESQIPINGPKNEPPNIGNKDDLILSFFVGLLVILLMVLNNKKTAVATNILINVAVKAEKSPYIPFFAAINPNA